MPNFSVSYRHKLAVGGQLSTHTWHLIVDHDNVDNLQSKDDREARSIQKKNYTFGGTMAFQICFAPSMVVISTKNDRYTKEAKYSLFFDHF
jgi:hypothetical protein